MRAAVAAGFVLSAALASPHPLHAAPDVVSGAPIRLYADTDDDDDDGVEDRRSITPWTAADAYHIDAGPRPLPLAEASGTAIRVFSDHAVLTAPPVTQPVVRLGVQGVEPGTASVVLGATRYDFIVCELVARESNGGVVNLASSHASLSRTLPAALSTQMDRETDGDAVVWQAICPRDALPATLTIQSFDPRGTPIDRLADVHLTKTACPPATAGTLECAESSPIRAVSDTVDRSHPAALGRSLRAEVGGRLVVTADAHKAASLRVGGPRNTALGAFERFSAKLRVHVLRATPAGQTAVGGDERGAALVAGHEARMASLLWGQCGIHFGREEKLRVEVVDPPGPYLLAVGCEVGLPASGGLIAFSADGKPVHVPTRAGDSPVAIAHAVARAVDAVGLHASVSPNSRISFGAGRTADVIVRHADGTLGALGRLGKEPLSTDHTLGVCVGDTELDDGLNHFDDLDAVAGTLEERALVKAYQDDDPSTVDVFIVPSFSKTGRIGESFIDTDGSGIQNVVIVDRAGIRAGARSYALAHELGHILLDMPGHPDDFGVDQPWMLMDADATDGTIFGPRRLSVDDCERALRESGPRALVPLLEPWPLYQTRTRAKSGPVRSP
ncbi:MAG TPA: hypothetical protein VH062_09110 [Polyangiaceae bacterium]|jgi:hypothetical protein|nr:hypothetical protein [Polyangiaceae bacterium]